MLDTVRGVGNDVGHTHGRTCKVKILTPAKAMLVTLYYIVWQHYFYFLFLHCFLWRFKEDFYMEPLLALLKSGKMWMLRHWGGTHTCMWTDLSTQQASLWRLPGLTQPGWARNDGGDLLTVTHTVFECGWKVHRTLSPYFSLHPHWNLVSSQSPRKVSDRNMNYLFKYLGVSLDRIELHGEGHRKISQQQQLIWSKNWYEVKKKIFTRKPMVGL